MLTAIEVLALFVLACAAAVIVLAVLIWLAELVDDLLSAKKRGQL